MKAATAWLRLLWRAASVNKAMHRALSLLLLALLLLSGCDNSALAGPRPAPDPVTAVEAYLQMYQPGPLPRLFQTTRIHDRSGVLLAEVYGEGRRTWVKLDQVSRHLVNATIATEDASFTTNSGIDPLRIVGAVWQNIDGGQIVSGASTITMQLARNLFLGMEQRYDQSLDRKILEVGLAQELTRLFSKDELLEMYLNMLNYGHLAYGPEAASQVYFGKSAIELTLSEATILAGIPQQPANLNPFQNWEAVKVRQRVVLDLMVRHGYLTEEGADAVFAAPVELNPAPDQNPNRAPHFVQFVIDSLDSRLGAGYTRRAGLNIITSLDLPMQEVAQQIVAEKVSELQPQYDLNNGALVALKHGSAEILVMVGSADFADEAIDGQVNVAVRLRQPGSAIKPLLYALAFNDNLAMPASMLWDTPITYSLTNGQEYSPLNYDRKFHGPVSLRTSLANSYNVPAVRLLEIVGVEPMVEGARAMGLQSLVPDPGRYGLSLTLGGGDVKLLDMVAAYHTLANAGQYLPPKFILSMTDNRGQPMQEKSPEPVPVISAAAAFLVTDILSDDAARAPTFRAGGPLTLSRPAAAKTGTTDDWRDNWTLGYTRYLVAGVWAGNTDGRPTQDSSGSLGAAPIWNAFMEAALADARFLQLLNAPQDEAAWEWQPPAALQLLSDCPPRVTCHPEGEYFTQSWLDLMGSAGPIADSIVYCDNNAVLRLPNMPRLPTDNPDAQTGDTQTAANRTVLPNEELAKKAVDAAIAWSRENGIAVPSEKCIDPLFD
ncbi:MAG: transglycosylase domain-containing protein [Caldilineaceae bacterium]|nr:transglycosylase domain-containing protein [Caldilineaceae bacterium]